MKRRRGILALLLLLVLVFTLSACKEKEKTSAETNTKDAGSTAGSGEDLSTVTLRVGATGWNLQGEILKAAGLADTPYKVEYTVFQGGNLGLEAMAADQIDFTSTSEIPPIFASLAENGGNFKIIAVNNSNTLLQELILPPGSAIKTVAELKGKKVGYIKSTTAQYFLYEMLKEAGLKWTDIDAVEISTADGVTALLGGNLDAFASYGNSINAAKNGGATTLASAQDILSGNFPYEASVKALGNEAKRAAIGDYLARLQLAYEWQKGHLEDWAKISADPTGQTVEDALDVLKKGYGQRDTKTVPISDEIKKSEQSVADAFYEVGLLEKKVDVSAFYDDTLTKAYQSALEALKK